MLFLVVACSIAMHVYVISSLECIDIPPRPMFGSLKVAGHFFARITCPNPDTDLPLNAPGFGGIFYCDPKEIGNELSRGVSIPNCLRLKHPNKLRMSILVTYVLSSCHDLDSVVNSTEMLTKKRLRSLDSVCAPVTCTWRTPAAECDDNKMFTDPGLPSQMDVTLYIETQYDRKKTVSFYLDILGKISQLLLAEKGFQGAKKIWNTDKATLVRAEIISWVAVCLNHPFTSGTNLALHKIASCRGCSVNHYYEAENVQCRQCPFNEMAAKPFSSECTPCPPEELWKNRWEEFKNLCYLRE